MINSQDKHISEISDIVDRLHNNARVIEGEIEN